MYEQTAFQIIMHIEHAPVVEHEIDFVVGCDLEHHAVDHIKALAVFEDPPLLFDLGVDLIDHIQQDPLAVRLTTLGIQVFAEQRAAEDRAVVHEGPGPPARVMSDKGMAVLVRHVAAGREADMSHHVRGAKRCSEALFKITAPIGGDGLFLDVDLFAAK